MGYQRMAMRISTGMLTMVPALAVAAPAEAAPQESCLGTGEVTVEEARAAEDTPQEILRRSGFDAVAADFSDDLCAAENRRAAEAVVKRHGVKLWQRAVHRAQSGGSADGHLSAGDDRPLYWARLEMTAAVRQWEPSFEVGEDQRDELIAALERWSRGHRQMDFPDASDTVRVVVTGFDPFRLDNDIRQSNPSGAVALALDGVTVDTGEGTAVIETAMFPVRWRDFTDGMVEEALTPHYSGEDPADAVITVSQGRDGQFDLEAYNGAWRGGGDDNEMTGTAEQIPIPERAPTVDPQPQWSRSTLDHATITEAETGRFPVYDNTQVTEIPAGETEPVTRPDGPTPGSEARAGGGGNYLSNEIAYRNTLLRDAVERDIPAGHVHTPVLHFGADNDHAISDDDFERNRADITEQVQNIIAVAVRG